MDIEQKCGVGSGERREEDAAEQDYCSTNTAGSSEPWETDDIEAKSRLVIPGHLDPQIGLFRIDAPTTSPLAVMVCATIAISLDWSFEVFDIMTAFLSGMRMERELYVRAPTEGLPSLQDLVGLMYVPTPCFVFSKGRTD